MFDVIVLIIVALVPIGAVAYLFKVGKMIYDYVNKD